jgi:hypothetical protein
MFFRIKSLAALVFIFHFATATGHAADRNRFFDSGQPRELINQPVCGSAEEPDDPRYCDFAQKT